MKVSENKKKERVWREGIHQVEQMKRNREKGKEKEARMRKEKMIHRIKSRDVRLRRKKGRKILERESV